MLDIYFNCITWINVWEWEMFSNTALGALDNKPEISETGLERSCPQETLLPGLLCAIDGQRCRNSTTIGCTSDQPRQCGERQFHSLLPGLVNLSTRSILKIVLLQVVPQLDGSHSGQLHSQSSWEYWQEWGLNNSSLGLQDVSLGQSQFFLLQPYKEAWSLVRVKINHTVNISLS